MDIEFNVLLNSVSFYIAPRTTKYVNLVCACHLGEEVPGPFPAPPPKSGKSALGTRLAIFLLLTQGTKCLHINSIPKIVIQFCYLTDLRLYRHWNCFLSSVATDGKDRRGFKLKTPGPTSSFNLMPFQAAKYPQENYYGLSDSWWNCVISSSRHYRSILCTGIHSVMTSA